MRVYFVLGNIVDVKVILFDKVMNKYLRPKFEIMNINRPPCLSKFWEGGSQCYRHSMAQEGIQSSLIH